MQPETFKEFQPVRLGRVEDLTAGDGTGFSDSGAHYKEEGGSIDERPYEEVPTLTL